MSSGHHVITLGGTLTEAAMASLHYLTIQDILWINLEITKKVRHFNYARLEEAVFYQYAYGESNTLLPQAARFLRGFLKMNPFEAGNEATALVACLAFLIINNHEPSASAEELGDWFGRFLRKDVDEAKGIEAIASPNALAHHAIVPDVRSAVRCVLEKYQGPVQSLYDPSAKQTA